MCAYSVTLAVGSATRHDTGRRIRVDVLANAPLEAAVIAEQSTEPGIEPWEYCYAKTVKPVPMPDLALAMAA